MSLEEEFRKVVKDRFSISEAFLDDIKPVVWEQLMPVLEKHAPDSVIDETTMSRGFAAIALWFFSMFFDAANLNPDAAMRKTRDIVENSLEMLGPKGK